MIILQSLAIIVAMLVGAYTMTISRDPMISMLALVATLAVIGIVMSY